MAYAGKKDGKRVRPIHWASNDESAEFFKECLEQTGLIYEVEDAEYLVSGSSTNAKVYAARLKVWGCAWSEKGAIAMMRIRAALASGQELIAPTYDPWLTEREKKAIKASRTFNYEIPYTSGSGYEPPQGSLPPTARIAPKLFGVLNFGRDLLPAHYPSP